MKLFRSTALMAFGLAAAFAAHGEGSGVSAEKAWNLLRDGNERFARALMANPHTSKERRNEVIEAEHPFAVLLSCSDSRVPAERVVDAGVGDVFSVRVAGNAAYGDMVIGSIEYGVLRGGARLVAVIGHESCDAVKAALSGSGMKDTSIGAMVSHVKPAADNASDKLHDLKGQDLVSEAVERNVLISMKDLLLASPKIADLVRSGEVMVVGGVYSLHTGRISWLGEHPSQKEILADKAAEGAKKK